jgi:hypothetical protein
MAVRLERGPVRYRPGTGSARKSACHGEPGRGQFPHTTYMALARSVRMVVNSSGKAITDGSKRQLYLYLLTDTGTHVQTVQFVI